MKISAEGFDYDKKWDIDGAMEQEVAKIKEKMQDVTITSRARMDFYEGTLEGKKVVVVRSGNHGACNSRIFFSKECRRRWSY